MKRMKQLLTCVLAFSLIAVSVSHAGLINYDRRNNTSAPAAANPAAKPVEILTEKPAAPAVETEAKAAAKTGPLWKRTSPRVNTRAERRYDLNRDGKLQASEVKMFLQDVTNVVNSKGTFSVDSDILKEYDKNGDGVINRYEAIDIRFDTSN